MNDRVTSLFPITMLLLFAALSIWLSQVVKADNPRGPERHDPDYIVENFNVRQFDVDGKLQHTLIAESMVHYPDDDTTVVTKPHMIYHRTPKSEIFANTANISQDGKQLDLVDEVRVVRHGVDGAPESVLTTQTLRIFPDEERAQTRAPVKLTQGQSVVTGSGLDIDNKAGITVMHGRVFGTLHRNPK